MVPKTLETLYSSVISNARTLKKLQGNNLNDILSPVLNSSDDKGNSTSGGRNIDHVSFPGSLEIIESNTNL